VASGTAARPWRDQALDRLLFWLKSQNAALLSSASRGSKGPDRARAAHLSWME